MPPEEPRSRSEEQVMIEYEVYYEKTMLNSQVNAKEIITKEEDINR
jgi:hypothetical protein